MGLTTTSVLCGFALSTGVDGGIYAIFKQLVSFLGRHNCSVIRTAIRAMGAIFVLLKQCRHTVALHAVEKVVALVHGSPVGPDMRAQGDLALGTRLGNS